MKNLFNTLAQWKRQWEYSTSVLRAAKAGIEMAEISNGVEILKAKITSIAYHLNRAPPRTRKIFTEHLLNTTLNNKTSPQDIRDLLDILAQSAAEATAAVEALNDPEEIKALGKITEAALRLEDWFERQDKRLVPVLDSVIRTRGAKEILTSMAPRGSYEITINGKPRTHIVPKGPGGP